MLKWLMSVSMVITIFLSYFFIEKKYDYFRFNESQELSLDEKKYLQFKESAKDLGIVHTQETLDPSVHLEGYQAMRNYKNFLPVASSVNAVDYNNDGYTDLFFLNGTSKRSYYLYKNNKKGSFLDVTKAVGLFSENDPVRISQSASFFDYDNDGFKDLIVSHGKFNRLFKNIGGKKFVEMTHKIDVNFAIGVITSIRVIDYNKDGWPDLYATMIFRLENSNNQKGQVSFFSPRITKNNRKISGSNFLLKNVNGKRFELVPDAGGASNSQLSWDAAIADINYDGWPDILVSNDFSLVRAYVNTQKNSFQEQTTKFLGKQFTSANMGIVFSDVNHDGLLDFYVSNVSRTTYSSLSHNQFYIQNNDYTFTDQFMNYGTDRCGWSWGSQFADFDLDGEDELIVANGMFDDGPNDFYYRWSVYVSLPTFLITNPLIFPNSNNHHLASKERNCLFKRTQNDETYRDVAISANVTDLYNGRGIALIDINNDGHLSFVVTNYSAPPTFYKNISELQRRWIGFSFTGTKSGNEAYGTILRVYFKNEKTYTKLFNPMQGFSSQSEPRVLIGLSDKQIEKIEITWPSGLIQKLNSFKENSYNHLTEPK